MAVITLSDAIVSALGPDGVSWGQARGDLSSSASDQTGNTQDRLGAPPRWTLSLAAPDGIETQWAVLWEELILQLRGRVNYLLAWDPKRPTLRGTAGGTMTVDGSHSAGATTLNLVVTGTGQVGKTILRGSPIQIGSGIGTSQLVRTIGDATFANVGGNSKVALTVEPPLRTAFTGGTAITYSKASAYFKLTNLANAWMYINARSQRGFALDLIERWN